MDKIALISDIHGNLEALKAVLKDIEKRKIKRIYCLGDIISKGVNSKECLEIIRNKCEVILRGNCDELFSSNIDPNDYDGILKQRIIWNKSKLTEEEQNYLYNLPYCYEFYMSGSLIRLFHASPKSIEAAVSNLDTLETKRSQFLPSENTISDKIADIVIYGHIHIQLMEQIYNRTMMNTGSVGNPIDVVRDDNFDANAMEVTRANYLILEGNLESKEYDNNISFQFIRLPYDIDKELASKKENIEKEAYIAELKNGKYRDMSRLIKSFKKRNINIELEN